MFRHLGRLANHNFCPNFDRRLAAWSRQPLTILIIAAFISGLVGIFLHRNGFVLFAGILATILIGSVWPVIGLIGVGGRVHFSRARSREGERNKVTLQLTNRSFLSPYGLFLRDDKSTLASLDSIPALSRTEKEIDFLPERRGVYPTGKLQLVTAFPFGLLHARRRLTVPQELIVWPKTFPVGLMPEPCGTEAVEGTVSRNRCGTMGDVLGVRPFRHGDSPRRIHWSQTARHDRLIVCELQSMVRPVIHIVLDVATEVHRGEGTDSSREWAIRIGASLSAGWLEQGAEIALTFGKQDFPASGGKPHQSRLLDALATIPDDTSESLQSVLARSSFRDGLRVVITTDVSLGQIQTNVPSDARIIVLRASSFDESPAREPPTDLRIVPWIVVSGPSDVANKLRNFPKETLYGV